MAAINTETHTNAVKDATADSSANDAAGDVLSMTVSTYEEMNPSRRNTMEDCHVVHGPGTWGGPPGLAYLGVYDGHGGCSMVEYLEHGLSFHVAEELKHDDDADMATRLERAFILADIHAAQQGVSTSGATVVLCLVKKIPNTNQILIHSANCGDARAVLGHQGRAIRLSRDHRVEDPHETERIEQAGGFVFKGRTLGVLAVTRSLGDHCMKDFVIARPFYNEITIEKEAAAQSVSSNDSDHENKNKNSNNNHLPPVLILACDGLWDVIQDQEAVDLALSYNGNKEDVAQLLVEEAMRRGSSDNITVIVAWL